MKQAPGTTWRLFVAIPMPEPARNEIIRVQSELQPLVPREVVRWTRPEQFHLTLRFLGDVPADAVETLKQAVKAVCSDASPLSLRAQGVGFFPNPRLPRVLWVGINDGENRLVDLQQRVEEAVHQFSPEPGEKQFRGHVTLARFKNPRPSDIRDLVARAQSLKTRSFGDWTAQEIEIMRSELSSSGARHTLLAACRLGTG